MSVGSEVVVLGPEAEDDFPRIDRSSKAGTPTTAGVLTEENRSDDRGPTTDRRTTL